jgi:hypothetical protein
MKPKTYPEIIGESKFPGLTVEDLADAGWRVVRMPAPTRIVELPKPLARRVRVKGVLE